MRAILRNARYTGHEVFGRQRRDYDLIDVSSPAEGHVRRMRWNDPSAGSGHPNPPTKHSSRETDWTRALSATAAVKQRAPKAASRPYLLRGRVFCASCGRRMHGQTRSGARRYYRCAAQARYPGITDAHPRDVLVREQPIIDALDEWLDELFAPEHATQTAQQIVAALAHGPDRSEHIDAARRRITAAQAARSNAAEQPYATPTRQQHDAKYSAGSSEGGLEPPRPCGH